jgi:hypothetical protein
MFEVVNSPHQTLYLQIPIELDQNGVSLSLTQKAAMAIGSDFYVREVSVLIEASNSRVNTISLKSLHQRQWKRTASKEMDMQVGDRLTGIMPLIDDEAVPARLDPLQASELRGDPNQPAHDLIVACDSGCCARDVLVGNDQDVGRCLGRDIPERGHSLLPVQLVGWNLTAHDFAKQAGVSFRH